MVRFRMPRSGVQYNRLVKHWICIGPGRLKHRRGWHHAVVYNRTGCIRDGGNPLRRVEWTILIWKV